MITIGQNFHIIHMTGDVVALNAWYEDVFSTWQYMAPSYLDIEMRDACLTVLGDLCIEPLAPAFEHEGWDAFPLGRFYNRFGQRWHSLAWFVDDGYGELYTNLKEGGVRLLGPAGVVQEGGEPVGPIFTHPKDTSTQLEFVPRYVQEPGKKMFVDPRSHGAFDPSWWSTEHPLGILKPSHVTIGTRDIARARDTYLNLLGATALHEAEVAITGSKSAFVLVGDLVVEFAEPTSDDSPLAADLDTYGESLWALTFKVRDLDAATAHLATKGVTPSVADATTMLADPATTHGVQMGFTSATIPNDPRKDWDQR